MLDVSTHTRPTPLKRTCRGAVNRLLPQSPRGKVGVRESRENGRCERRSRPSSARARGLAENRPRPPGSPRARGSPSDAKNRGRTTRGNREPPTDAEIERGLRERAVSDPRAAEILLRWLQRARTEEQVGGIELDAMSERELERLYAGLLRLARLDESELAALVEHALAGEPLGPS